MAKSYYLPLPESKVSLKIRFDTTPTSKGMMVEVAFGGVGYEEHVPGDPYKRTRDGSMPPAHPQRDSYFRRVNGWWLVSNAHTQGPHPVSALTRKEEASRIGWTQRHGWATPSRHLAQRKTHEGFAVDFIPH